MPFIEKLYIKKCKPYHPSTSQQKRKIMRLLLYHYFILWNLLLLYQGQDNNLLINADSSTNNPSTSIIGAPEKYDDWCKNYCSSNTQCNVLFHENYIDLRIRLVSNNNNGFNNDGLSFHGNTVARQTLETQLILDISHAIEVSPCQIYILHIEDSQTITEQEYHQQQQVINKTYEEYYHDEEHNDIMVVSFRLYPSDIEKIKNITHQVQNFPNSQFYNGKVTASTDAMYGVQVKKWDFSIKLQYSILMFGIDITTKDSSTNKASEERILSYENDHWCHNETNNNSIYCEFEHYFEDDISKSLNISQIQVNIFQIKSVGMDSIAVYFRFLPDGEILSEVGDAVWISQLVDTLKHQIQKKNSTLYKGNVTYNVDPIWGISGYYALPRSMSKHKVYTTPSSSRTETLIKNDYERCKQTQRCSRGWHDYNQSTDEAFSTTQLFSDGHHENIPLFLDFENWKEGTRGWSISRPSFDNTSHNNSILYVCSRRANATTNAFPLPAYQWCPFLFPSSQLQLRDNYDATTNELILNEESLINSKLHQSRKVVDIEHQIQWTRTYMDKAALDAKHWARIHVKNKAAESIKHLNNQLKREQLKLKSILNPCNQSLAAHCELTFNTSSLKLYGAMNATGNISKTPDGTEVAVWAFDSIDIAEGVHITVTGQRALALFSRSSININTTILVSSGTLGGFPGGYSVARKEKDRLHRICREIKSINETSEEFVDNGCEGDIPITKLINNDDIISNNVNGPGSGSTRVYSMTIETIAPFISKVQTITTYVPPGQTISGGFTVHFHNYSTGIISYDTTAGEMKQILENALNAADITFLENIDRTNISPGIGRIDVTRLLSVELINNGGFLWKITFTSAIGNIAPLQVTNHLSGKGVTLSTDVITQGNEIGGNFSLNFLGFNTRAITHIISDAQLKKTLLNDIPVITSAYVVRTDPRGNCHDGLCFNGPSRSGGYTWTLTLTTQQGNVSPLSPTSNNFDMEGEISNMTVLSNNLTGGCIELLCPTVLITNGYERSSVAALKSMSIRKPYSLAFGGMGAGNGGSGGIGYGVLMSNTKGETYGDKYLTNLHGGSGGALGYVQPYEVNLFARPNGRGGSGGGAIQIVATNDIIFGTNAVISCDGESGSSSFMMASGGGSGGSILLKAGGVIHNQGSLSAKGGKGGVAAIPNGRADIEDGHGGGGGGGRITFYAEAIFAENSSKMNVIGGTCSSTKRNCHGKTGTIFLQEELKQQDIIVDTKTGAANTASSLLFNRSSNDNSLAWDHGPEYNLIHMETPTRISFFMKLGDEKINDNGFGGEKEAAFELRERPFAESILHGIDDTAMIGIYFGDWKMKHGNNYNSRGSPNTEISMKIFQDKMGRNLWYKADILINWKKNTYDIYLNDILVVAKSVFQGERIQTIGIQGNNAWFDEIYAGIDTTMNFACPEITPEGNIVMDRPMEQNWKQSDITGDKTGNHNHDMTRHESHLSRRVIYNRDDNGGLVPFDGEGHAAFIADIKYQEPKKVIKGEFHPGSFITTNENQTRFLWYGEHDNTAAINHDDIFNKNYLRGGVAACSTTDFVTWKNEGIMLHYINISDSVLGSQGPFHIQRPKVIYNNRTKKYVMWMNIENELNDLGMAGVAMSDYSNGPFTFLKSFYPDGNKTKDQTLFQTNDNKAFLIRTYYASVDVILPASIMQPIWESVKEADGITNDFALSYHRANYEPEYDDYHDIFLQRYRQEDKPWKIICVNKVSKQERDIAITQEGDYCNDDEYKQILGQGNPAVTSRFLDPNDPDNSVWKPNSVPGVKSQPWSANYQDGICGKRISDQDLNHFDPNIPTRETQDSNRADCSNIADNPTHRTSPDKLIGSYRVAETRRAKFVAISQLTEDYLNTNGILKSYEGELEEEMDLISFFKNNDLFGDELLQSSSTSDISSTYHPPMYSSEFQPADDWGTRFHQYENTYNDKAYYSAACIIDGKCPVNFRDQITDDHI